MKKRIMVVLVMFMFVTIGGFTFSKIVEAENFIPNIEFTIDSQDEIIKSFIGSQFEIMATIKPGDIEYVNTAPSTSNNVGNIYIEAKPLYGLEFKGIKMGNKVINAIDGKVNLDDIKYEDTSTTNGWKTLAKPINLKLIYTSSKDGKFDGVGEINLLYKENERAKDPKQVTKKLTPNNKPIIEIGKLQFIKEPKFEKAGLIYGSSEVKYPTKENPLEVGLNRYFEVDCNISTGTLGIVSKLNIDKESELLSDVNINSDRNLIYVVDKAVIDIEGGNEETARESIKKSLEELKISNPDVKTSLIVYGEKAEIISNDDKTTLSIEQLIAEIDAIKSSDKSGNLGDAIRKAKYLANKNENINSSIIIVSAGNPNYYTKLSEGNDTLLESRNNKEGTVAEDIEIAAEYVNNIVNDIAVNEFDETRWYGINYGIEQQQLLLNDCIDKLEGLAPQIKNPYYDDFALINTNATTPIKIKASLEVKSKDNRIEIHPEDIKKDFEFGYSQNGEIIEPLVKTQNIKIRVKINDVNNINDVINIISLDEQEGIEAILRVEIDGQLKTYKFNENMMQELYTKVTNPYIAKVGLYNGKTSENFDSVSKEININDIVKFNKIAQAIIEDVPSPELAIENDYSFAALIKSDSNNKVRLFYDNQLVAGEVLEGKVYEVYVNAEGFVINNNFVKITKSSEVELIPGKTYLIIIDDYIENDKIDINEIGNPFEIGITIFDSNNIEKQEDWTITINPVSKPKHFKF